jgi:hypothetical protein
MFVNRTLARLWILTFDVLEGRVLAFDEFLQQCQSVCKPDGTDGTELRDKIFATMLKKYWNIKCLGVVSSQDCANGFCGP